MMAQNLTKFTLTMVVLGIILALAVFRPSILPGDLLKNSSAKAAQKGSPTTVSPAEPSPATVAKCEALFGERKAALDEREAALNEREQSLNAIEARLREQEASLADREQNLKGLRRCFVAALIGGGLLAGLLVLVLVTQARQDHDASGKTPGGKGGQRIRLTQTWRSVRSHYNGAAATAVPAYRGNGRNRESVKQ
jgi:hypothetical protein